MFRSLFTASTYAVVPVEGMNEVYVTGPARFNDVANSDNVFYTRHVDGPLSFMPFVSVYRCIVGMDWNEMVTTHFPLADVSNNACEGDVIGFDFNREVHYITRDEERAGESDDFRVVLKLHYCVYPRLLAPIRATQLVSQLRQLVRDALASAAEATGLRALWRHTAELLCGGHGQHSNEEEENEHIRHIL